MPRERLEAAPGFPSDAWPDFAVPQWGGDLYRHYGVAAWWRDEGDEER